MYAVPYPSVYVLLHECFCFLVSCTTCTESYMYEQGEQLYNALNPDDDKHEPV